MIACDDCAAKFRATPETERLWLERHIARFHPRGQTNRADGRWWARGAERFSRLQTASAKPRPPFREGIL